MYKYIGTNQVSFEHGRVYEAKRETDAVIGDCYAVKDESGDWYCYSTNFFEKNFVKVG